MKAIIKQEEIQYDKIFFSFFIGNFCLTLGIKRKQKVFLLHWPTN